MTTVGKVAIGAAVVIGGVVIYKMVSKPDPVATAARQSATSPAAAVNGFLNLATSVFGYFTRNPPAPSAVPTSSWNASSDLNLPLLPGQPAYEDSTRNDYLLS